VGTAGVAKARVGARFEVAGRNLRVLPRRQGRVAPNPFREGRDLSDKWESEGATCRKSLNFRPEGDFPPLPHVATSRNGKIGRDQRSPPANSHLESV
jgi:hypothetical protein